MCMCGKPTRNGEQGYSWDGKAVGVRPVAPPALADGETIVFDEPGRCGGLDSHCHHFLVIRDRYGKLAILVRNGGGDDRMDRLANREAVERALSDLDSDGRYWLLVALYHSVTEAADKAREAESQRWRLAAAEKRIKTRKERNSERVKVWIKAEVR